MASMPIKHFILVWHSQIPNFPPETPCPRVSTFTNSNSPPLFHLHVVHTSHCSMWMLMLSKSRSHDLDPDFEFIKITTQNHDPSHRIVCPFNM